MNEHPEKEISTFHSGKYILTAKTGAKITALYDAVCALTSLPMTDADRKSVISMQTEKAVYGILCPDDKGITFEQVSRIIQHDRSNFTQDFRSIEAINAHCALQYAIDNANKPMTQEILTSINTELCRNLVPDGAEGILRKAAAKPQEENEYAPPFSALDINLLIKNLLDWLRSKETAGVNPMIKGMLLHMHLKKIRPFSAYNCQTARIAEVMYLRSMGITTPAMMIPNICVNNKNEYTDAVNSFYKTSDVSAYAEFIFMNLLTIYGRKAAANRELYRKNAVMEHLNRLLENKELIKRQHAFLVMLYQKSLTFEPHELQLKKTFTKFYGKVSRTTTSRDIRKFMDMNLIIYIDGKLGFNSDILSL